MSTLQVHLLMLALALVAFLFIASPFKRNRATHHWKKPRGRTKKRILGLLAGLVIALAPFSRFWRSRENGFELLTQSALVAAIGLIALMLFALLSFRKRSSQSTRKGEVGDAQNTLVEEQIASDLGLADYNASDEPSIAPIMIDADIAEGAMETVDLNANALTSKQQASDAETDNNPVMQKTLLMDSDKPQAEQQKTESIASVNDQLSENTPSQQHFSATDGADLVTNSIHQAPTLPVGAASKDAPLATVNTTSNINEVQQELDLSSAANDQQQDTVKSLHERRRTDGFEFNQDHNKPQMATNAIEAEDELDLSDSEKLFAKIRNQSREVELPEEQSWLDADSTAEYSPLDLDDDLEDGDIVLANREASDQAGLNEDASIEDAEVIENDASGPENPTDHTLDFGNDLTGEYAHPVAGRAQSPATEIPATLDDALQQAKLSTSQLTGSIEELENGLVQLDELRNQTVADQQLNNESSARLLTQKEDLLKSEDSARKAAESVIAAQSVLIEKARKQQALIGELLSKERMRLRLQQQEISRSREMARKAAMLARKAAVAQHEIRDVAKREQEARMKSQESTRKAVNIARTAISALAKEERKRGVVRH